MAFVRYSQTIRVLKNADSFKKYCTIPRITQPKIDVFSKRQNDTEDSRITQPKNDAFSKGRKDTEDEFQFQHYSVSNDSSARKSKIIRPNEVQRISIPPAVSDRLYQKKLKLIEKNVAINPRFHGPVLIQCKNKKLNHYVGQSYHGYGKDKLASAHWKKKSKYVGDYFTIGAVERNPALLDKSHETTFKATGLREDICKVLEEQGIHYATNIQMLAIPSLLEGKSVMSTAETGGGKTLAFLLPMIQHVLDMKDKYGPHQERNQPLGIILAPSHELADQIYKVTRVFSEPLGFMVRFLVGRYSAQVFKRNEKRQVDILVATPGILSKTIYLKQINLERLRMVVLDEADTLMDDSFKFIMDKIILRTTKNFGISLTTSLLEDQTSLFERENDPDGEASFSNSDNSEDEDFKMIANDWVDKTHVEDKYHAINSSKEASQNIIDNDSGTNQRKEIDSSESRNEIDITDYENRNHRLYPSNSLLSKEKLESEFSREDHFDKDTLSDAMESKLSDPNDTAQSVIECRYEDSKGEDVLKEDFREGGLIQFCMVGASLPADVAELLGDLVPAEDVEVVKTDSIHRILPHIVQKFQRVSNESKIELLISTVKKNMRKAAPTIVFCNKSSTVRYLSQLLQDCGVEQLSALHKIHGRHGDRIGIFHEWYDGKTDLLVTTDLASRGLDTTRAKMVINYDFPDHMVDYLHRAGRVGRVGSQGTGIVFNFIQHKWDVELCWEIELAARKGTEFQGLNSNIKQYHNTRHEAKRPTVIELNV